jgi:hypothetical protein
MTTIPDMQLDEYLQILRSATPTDHNPFAADPELAPIAPTFAALTAAAADFVDACRLHIPGDGYEDSLGLLHGIVDAFPEPQHFEEADIAALLSPLATDPEGPAS